MSNQITLDTVTRKLQAYLGEATNTNECQFSTNWVDLTVDGSKANSGHTPILSNGVTAVDIVGVPAASTQRVVVDGEYYNADVISHVVYIRYNDNGTTKIIGKCTLAAGVATSLANILNASVNPATTLYRRYVEETCYDYTTDVAVANGVGWHHIASDFNGMNLVEIHAFVITAGTTNSTTIQVYNFTDSVNMLSTAMAIETGETGTDTSATPGTIDTAHDDVATNDLIRFDVTGASTTKAKGLIVTLGFALP
jgi:hypothetical protein